MSRYLLNRRQFSAGCAAFGLTLPAILARAAAALGPDTAEALKSLRVVLRESPVASAAFEGPLG